MEDLNAYVSYYLERLEGPDGAHAWHSLREAGAAVLPYLAVALRDEQSPAVRERVVELIWQTREPSAVGTLATALEDPAPQVWKAALDGLVTIGGPSVTALLRSALAASQRGAHRVPADWLAQAIEQLEAAQ